MTPTIHSVHTPCKKCVFAKYNGITQDGCHLQYLDVYKSQNIEILEAYDEDAEFYVVNDKKCIGYREDKWFEQFGDEAQTIEDKINIFNKTNQLNYLVVINLSSLDTDHLDQTLSDLTSANVKPQKIVFVRYRTESLSFSYTVIEELIKKHNIDCAWRVQTMLADDYAYDEVLHHLIMDSKKYRFVLSIDSKGYDPAILINKANDIVHKELGQFLILADPSKRCRIFSGSVYRFAIANRQDIFSDDNNYMIL